MRLRRGMVRESCDFCHRRKIKCDRLTRNDMGHTACSQCSLRSVQCCMDDSDDIRLRGRCQPGAVGSAGSAGSVGLPPTPQTAPSSSQTAGTPARRTLRQKGGQETPTSGRLSLPVAGASPVSTVSMSSMDEAQTGYRQPPQHIAQPLATASLATPSSMSLDVAHVDAVDHLLSQQQQAASQSASQSAVGVLSTPSLSYTPINTNINAITNAPPSSSMTDDLMFLDDPFYLNADSIFFLDQIFTGYPDGPAYGTAPTWPNTTAMSSDLQQQTQPLVMNPIQHQPVSQPIDSDLTQQPQHQQQPQQSSQPQPQQVSPHQEDPSQPPPDGLKGGGYDPPPWTRCGLDESTFLDALRAYFSYTTLYLPILLEDAFWQDYHAGRCSLSIIYAVACRGLPFASPPSATTDHRLIWKQQQRVAEQFREAFFAAQLSANRNRGRARLDDLEALALMLMFKYRAGEPNDVGGDTENGGSLSQLHAHLAGLYLTHDSLVLMTMQSGIDVPEDPGSQPTTSTASTATASSDPTAPLARLQDRRTLLFWHVYGLDSFHCLEKKTLSRIPDCNHHLLLPVSSTSSASASASASSSSQLTTSPKNLPNLPRNPEEARGYLDAVLDLAVIARKALVTLSNATARRGGVRADKLEAVYRLLEQWRRTACPPHLRRQKDQNGRLSLSVGAVGGQIQLHRAVIWMLEVNIYLQIEDCVAEYGIHQDKTGDNSLNREVLALRVESETVRQLRDSVEIARSMLQYDKSSRKGTTFSLPDLGTSIIRDCCIGLAQWACDRGKEKKFQKPPTPMRVRANVSSAGEAAEVAEKRRIMATYLEAATVLRDAAATAVSNNDTQPNIDNLDKRIATLVEAMEDLTAK